MHMTSDQRRQAIQLAVLTLIHATVDMFGGMLPALLPEIRRHFGLSLAAGIGLLSVLNLFSNSVQIATGHLRARNPRPFFIPTGALLATLLVLMALLPGGAPGRPWLFLLAAIGGCGIAVVHPEGLRAVHALDRLPGALSTSVFMTGGFLGFAGGAWVATMLVSHFGLPGLQWLALFAAVGLIAFYILPPRLAVEPDPDLEPAPVDPRAPPVAAHVSFWQVLLIAIPAAIGSTLIASLLPTRLNELHFTLTHGGFASLAFGVGSAAGSLGWAIIARRRGELTCITIGLLSGVPILIMFLLLIKFSLALILLMAGGACAGSAYPLLVALARRTSGPILGTRMALMVGGTWGTASILLLALGPVAERWGSQPLLFLAVIAFFVSGLLARRLRAMEQLAMR